MNVEVDLAHVRQSLYGHNPAALERRRRAAVALVLAGEESAPLLLLVRRTERPSDPWSGHMALPGGHAEPQDSNLFETARREVREEVGVDLSAAELLGQLDDVSPLTSSNIAVSPFVFWLGEQVPLLLSAEVSEALWVPLAVLVRGELRTAHEVQLAERRLVVPAFVIKERVVWGMTFRVLEMLVARILPAILSATPKD
jgi:8-oxo-dGTP pyrophosphatase MutT (NUDIX family)